MLFVFRKTLRKEEERGPDEGGSARPQVQTKESSVQTKECMHLVSIFGPDGAAAAPPPPRPPPPPLPPPSSPPSPPLSPPPPPPAASPSIALALAPRPAAGQPSLPSSALEPSSRVCACSLSPWPPPGASLATQSLPAARAPAGLRVPFPCRSHDTYPLLSFGRLWLCKCFWSSEAGPLVDVLARVLASSKYKC